MEKTVIADTGFVVALLNRSDAWHKTVVPFYLRYEQILLPQTVLAETAYLVGQSAGIPTVVKFLQGLPESHFHLAGLGADNVKRIAEILDQYSDSRIDFVDASVMAVAEYYGIKTVLTLDHRDFRIYRPVHCQFFEILP